LLGTLPTAFGSCLPTVVGDLAQPMKANLIAGVSLIGELMVWKASPIVRRIY